MKEDIYKPGFVKLPIEYGEFEEEVIIVGEENLTKSIIAQGKTFEEAEKEFIDMLYFQYEYHLERSDELDLWKPFQHGEWNHIGGSWFTIFGIHVYIRIGKGMRGGWYVPFTTLNITVNNRWRRKKRMVRLDANKELTRLLNEELDKKK